ncbi:MAG: hypothetical protein ACOC54_00720 [Candidatus Sumerlaeota bacterium]
MADQELTTPKKLFSLSQIEKSLIRFQESFDELNRTLSLHREPFTDVMLQNILEAYDYLNQLLVKNIDLFTPAGLHSMLELNHLILCGKDSKTRYEYHNHILETRNRYMSRIGPIRKWVLKRRTSPDPYKLATGFYNRAVSQPQLFVEGNHRTGNIVVNYLLLSLDAPPYIITPETARDYLEISGEIKFTNMESFQGSVFGSGITKRQFRKFLEKNVDDKYMRGYEGE